MNRWHEGRNERAQSIVNGLRPRNRGVASEPPLLFGGEESDARDKSETSHDLVALLGWVGSIAVGAIVGWVWFTLSESCGIWPDRAEIGSMFSCHGFASLVALFGAFVGFVSYVVLGLLVVLAMALKPE